MDAPPLGTLTEKTLREALRAELARRKRAVVPTGTGKPSAVLVPLFEWCGDVHVWLLRRAQRLRSHSGQVAFPGGRHEEEDESLVVTALREAEEEIGLLRSDVDVLGPLDDYVTVTGYTITPYVGWVPSSLQPRANPMEVARVFPVPLRLFLTRSRWLLPRLGYRHAGELVWGATAAIAAGLGQIVRRVGQDAPPQ